MGAELWMQEEVPRCPAAGQAELSPGAGLSSWLSLLRASQSSTRLRQLYLLQGGKYLPKDITLSMELGKGEQKTELTRYPTGFPVSPDNSKPLPQKTEAVHQVPTSTENGHAEQLSVCEFTASRANLRYVRVPTPSPGEFARGDGARQVAGTDTSPHSQAPGRILSWAQGRQRLHPRGKQTGCCLFPF